MSIPVPQDNTIELSLAAGPRVVTVRLLGYAGDCLGSTEKSALRRAVDDAVAAINDEIARSNRRIDGGSPVGRSVLPA